MASLSRVHNLSSLRKIFPSSGKFGNVTARRWLSKSEGKQDATTGKPSSPFSNAPEVPRNWVSYGFSHKNYYEDRVTTHVIMFMAVSWALLGSCWILYYYPDMNRHEWYQREAFLELKRREAAGLPLVDPDYVPSSQIKLPSDEELGSYKIII